MLKNHFHFPLKHIPDFTVNDSSVHIVLDGQHVKKPKNNNNNNYSIKLITKLN